MATSHVGSPPPTREVVSRAVVPTLVVAALAVSMSLTIVIAALPAFGRQLGVQPTAAAWVLTSFMLASAVATPIAGRLGDMLGYRRVLMGCLALFVLGTVCCAVAVSLGSFGWAIVGRVAAGVSGGVFPLAFGIVRSAVPVQRRPSAIALLSAMFGIGGAVGIVFAGPIVGLAGPAWVFWPLAVLGVVAIGMSTLLPRDDVRAQGRIDVLGGALMAAGLVGLLLVISEGAAWGWGSPALVSVAVATVVLLVCFALTELHRSEPLIDLRLLRSPTLALTNVVTVVIGAAMFGAITLIPRFVQTPVTAGYGFSASPTMAGVVLIPMAVAMLVVTPLVARLHQRSGPRLPLRLGQLCAVLAFVVLAVAHDRWWHFLLAGLIVGAGYGLAFASLGNLVVDSVGPHQVGVATGVNTIARTAGGAVGAQLAVALLVAGSTATGLPGVGQYVTAFVVFAAVAFVAFLLTGLIRLGHAPAATS